MNGVQEGVLVHCQCLLRTLGGYQVFVMHPAGVNAGQKVQRGAVDKCSAGVGLNLLR